MPRVTEPGVTWYVVVEPFIADEGAGITVYARGELVRSDHPTVKLMPDRFRPFVEPHPVPRQALSTPELRAD